MAQQAVLFKLDPLTGHLVPVEVTVGRPKRTRWAGRLAAPNRKKNKKGKHKEANAWIGVYSPPTGYVVKGKPRTEPYRWSTGVHYSTATRAEAQAAVSKRLSALDVEFLKTGSTVGSLSLRETIQVYGLHLEERISDAKDPLVKQDRTHVFKKAAQAVARVSPELLAKKADKVLQPDQLAIRVDLERKSYSAHARNTTLCFIGAAVNYCHQNGKVDRQWPRLRVEPTPSRKEDSFTPKQMLMICHEFNIDRELGRNQLAYNLVQLQTGARTMEVSRLNCRDLYRSDEGLPMLRISVPKKHGCDAEREPRSNAIHEDLWTVLDSQFRVGRADAEPLFLGPRHGRRLIPDIPRNHLKRIGFHRLGIGELRETQTGALRWSHGSHAFRKSVETYGPRSMHRKDEDVLLYVTGRKVGGSRGAYVGTPPAKDLHSFLTQYLGYVTAEAGGCPFTSARPPLPFGLFTGGCLLPPGQQGQGVAARIGPMAASTPSPASPEAPNAEQFAGSPLAGLLGGVPPRALIALIRTAIGQQVDAELAGHLDGLAAGLERLKDSVALWGPPPD